MAVKKKLLIIQDELGRYSEVFLYRMLRGFKCFDVEVLVGKHVNKSEYPFEGVKQWNGVANTLLRLVYYIRYKFFNYHGIATANLGNLISMINETDADLVCFQFAFIPEKLGKDVGKINKPFCIIHHGTDVNLARENKIYCLRLNLVWGLANKLFFVSNFLMNEAVKLGCPPHKAHVNYLGVPDFKPSYANVIPVTDIFRFVMVARQTPVKNHTNVIRAFAKANKESSANMQLVLIGGGELESEIRHQIKMLGLENHISLMGDLSNGRVVEEISKSHCLILASRIHLITGALYQEEALGLSILEGMILGKPIVASATGGIPEVVSNGLNGFLVDPLDVNGIKEAILEMVNYPEKALEMGQRGRKLARKLFNFKLQMRKFEQHFIAIVESHGS